MFFFTEGIGNGYWISGVRRKSSPELVWFTNGRPLVYNKFQNGQPDNAGNIEACVEVFVNRRNEILWNDYNCEGKIGYICQTYVRNLTCESISKSTSCDEKGHEHLSEDSKSCMTFLCI